MPNTNGHGPKQAVLYARVSTDEQARSGYSLAQQIEALREYASREGYEVLEEIVETRTERYQPGAARMVAESAYLSRFLRSRLPTVPGSCDLRGLSSGVINQHRAMVTRLNIGIILT